ncbi:apolipoprotein N-acyltransferase [Microbacterium faecale]|uniref:Apolipoprotein N-acyltransferase n=1 Tax=Microbacterium faecale TaxID=1804630 RepID=A0A916YAY3_9MICO|nr:apolipoprotein N-acyltransferase [Microbacterium faecale]GGD37414.1 apolipoprotein N-acyltransferase [Microbacterium faecale]
MTAPAPTRAPLPLWAAFVASALGGISLDASFPSFGVWPLAFVAVALALVSLIGRRSWAAFGVGAAFGAAFYFPHIDWAASFLGDHPLSWVPWAALAGIQTFFTALGAVVLTLAYRWSHSLIGRPGVRVAATALLVAGVWTARELIMGSWPYGGFPWGRIGMSPSESPLATVSSWVGVTGLTFLMVAIVALAIEAVRWSTMARGRSWWSLSAPVALLAILVAVPAFPTEVVGSLRVVAVQGNGPTAYIDEHGRYDVLDAQLAASAPAIGEDADVVVWPEGGVGLDPATDANAARVLTAAADAFDAPILLNAAVADGDAVYNRSMLWRDGVEQSHDKRYPVPFGEYVPQREFYEAIVPSLIQMIGREYTPGTDAPTMAIGEATVGLAICFDVIFDDHIDETIDGGAQALMFQTNNADFRGTDENLQQLAFARMRAIETGRSVVNVSTVGTSQLIRADGTTIEQIGVAEAGALVADIELREGATPAVVAGSWIRGFLLWMPLLAVAIMGALVDRMRRLRPAE